MFTEWGCPFRWDGVIDDSDYCYTLSLRKETLQEARKTCEFYLGSLIEPDRTVDTLKLGNYFISRLGGKQDINVWTNIQKRAGTMYMVVVSRY